MKINTGEISEWSFADLFALGNFMSIEQNTDYLMKVFDYDKKDISNIISTVEREIDDRIGKVFPKE